MQLAEGSAPPGSTHLDPLRPSAPEQVNASAFSAPLRPRPHLIYCPHKAIRPRRPTARPSPGPGPGPAEAGKSMLWAARQTH